MRLLVVDDNQAYAEMLRAILARSGYEVGVASSGAEGLDMVRRLRPALILLDLYMTDGDGDAVCRRLKAEPETAGIPVVMMSGGGRKDEEARCVAAGCDQFLTKPIRQAELLLAVASHLQAGMKSLRVDLRLPVVLESAGRRSTASSVNISLGGIFLEASHLLQPGTEMLLELVLPAPGGPQPLVVRGKVAWLNRPEAKIKRDLPAGMGIQFTKMTPEAQSALGLFLAAVAGGRPPSDFGAAAAAPSPPTTA